ncbi:PREDICTED: translocase of chloroplast 120, chloroplastic-like [Tarenaya hassleriana]|uniref:translocase of chloroplast 120, chloroplastic-like n=1 Tax=Tarenaya hassleriana TaxID=28532 RepID=UPI00053C8B31|nr:PREDICTED: translocase of chloroplast 120, chloroplastic-like [Tarenaya hassleriana]XP_019057385.1 PREDICTED: translocase of chloroplast 120, chloroplastic-like [Tarenaya hassleriana]
MGDEADVVDESHPEKNTVKEDRVSGEKVEKSELVGSDEARDAEDEVFEEAVDSQEDFPEDGRKPESSEASAVHEDSALEVAADNSKGEYDVDDFEEATGTPNDTSNNEAETSALKVENLVDAKCHLEANVPNTNGEGEAEADFATPEINGDRGEFIGGANQAAEIANAHVEVNSDVVKNPEKFDATDSNSLLDNGSMENGNVNLIDENGVGSHEEKEPGTEVVLKDAEPNDSGDSSIEDGNELSASISAGTRLDQQVDGGEGMDNSFSEKGSVYESNDPGAKRNGDLSSGNELAGDETAGEAFSSHISTEGDYTKSDVRNTSGDMTSSMEKIIVEEKGEAKGHSNGLEPVDHLVSPSLSSNSESAEVQSNNDVAEGKDRESEAAQSINREQNVQQNARVNKEHEQQQSSDANVEHQIKVSSQVGRDCEEPRAVSSAFPTESRSNLATSPPVPPAGLGRAAPLLEPAPRVSQQPRVNGSVSHTQAQQVEDSTATEADEHDETREKLQMIRVKFLRLAHRLGQTPHNVVVAQVLYRLGLAEQLRGRSGSRVGAFSFDRASAMAEQLEAAGQEPLDFSCTIMVLGKSGVGKSATINSIFDEMKFGTDAFQMGTKKVQDVEGFVQGIKVRVIDTPGLLPSWSDQRQNEKILNSVKSFIKKTPPDIVLYLDRLDMQSRDSGDMPLLRTITDIFGPSIWFNAIVVLTHAASAPPDGPNGTASSYDMFVTQRSHVIQQAIRQAAGDLRLMNPVSLVENHSACRTNRAGQRVLPNGQVWKPHLLLLSFASKILAEANALLKLQDNMPGRPFATRSKAPPLPFLLSSLLQSRPQVKLPDDQYGDEEAEEDDLVESSDSEEESEYDQLPPFKRLTKAQMSKLSRAQRKQYLDELEYREKLFMKKQMKEERKRRRMMKKLAAEIKDLPNEYNENVEEESNGPASVPVPMPDLALPASFDSDNPTHRYRYLDSSNQWLVRPVLETHGWDHDVGYEGVNVERLFVVKDKIPVSFSGQVTKDKKDANVQLEMASSVKHGEGKSTSLGFDMQNVGKELAYTLRSEMRFNNFRRNKAAAGLSVTLLGDSLSAGVKIEDKLIANKRFRLVLSGGAMTGRGDVAYGGSLEAQLRDKDYPLGRFLTTLGLSVMDWHGDLAIGGNIQTQLPIGRSTNLVARGNLNNRGAGQVSIRLNSSEQLQLALVAMVPLFKKLVSYYQQMQYEQ